MISIIIPIHNQAGKITKTLDSLFYQTERDLEIIIVNDGSTDGVDSVLERYLAKEKSDISVFIIHQKNMGAPSARNAGRKKANGDYLFFCDSDVVLLPQTLETMKKTLDNHPEVSFVYSSFMWGRKLFKLWPYDAEKLKRMPYINTMSLIRTKDFPFSGWDEKLKKLQDWDLWLTMREEGKLGYFIDQVLFQVAPGGEISSWLPSFFYALFPFLPKVKKYKEAMAIVKKKHGLG
jgi:glycosyltransferase involved in cell wall biosynthesis